MKKIFSKETLSKIYSKIVSIIHVGKWLFLSLVFFAGSLGFYVHQSRNIIEDQRNLISTREREILFLTQENSRLQKDVLPPPGLEDALNQKERILSLERENNELKTRVLQWQNYCKSKQRP